MNILTNITAARDIDGVMKIKRVMRLGSQDPQAQSLVGRQPRRQPEGLKARFQPIGVHTSVAAVSGSANTDDGDVEMKDAPTKSAGKKEKKRKTRDDVTDSAVPETPKKKRSKSKHTSSDDEAAAAAEQLIEEQLSRTPQLKALGSPVLGAEGTGASAKKTKKSKKADVTPHTSVSPELSKKETPIPLPSIPGFSLSQLDQSTPQKKLKRVKGTPKSAVSASRQSPPASAQASKTTK